ncbi:MAG: FadR/GntR family transcriptional regulator [Sporomusaceae bacterium]|nr:FadR/GntR family transcriptional regulator [Sporomusaceae bacterium]
MKFQQIVTRKLYELVIDQIKEMIYHKRLVKGDKLPSERDLAVQLGVSRTAIREALRALEMLGLIVSHHGEGTFIASAFPEEKLFEPLSLVFMLEDNPTELSEVRAMLEIQCAGLAAEKIKPEELQLLAACVQEFQTSQESPLLAEVDKNFHTLIAKASHNRLLYHLYSSIHEVVSHHIVNMRYLIISDRQNSSILLHQHKAIYESIATGDVKKAREAMTEHMVFVRSQFDSKYEMEIRTETREQI